MATPKKILEDAFSLSPTERAKLVDKLIQSLDIPNPELDKLWAEEAESRLEAYKRGELEGIPAEEVFDKYK